MDTPVTPPQTKQPEEVGLLGKPIIKKRYPKWMYITLACISIFFLISTSIMVLQKGYRKVTTNDQSIEPTVAFTNTQQIPSPTITSLLLFTPPADWTKYSDTRNNFTISYPKTWKREASQQGIVLRKEDPTQPKISYPGGPTRFAQYTISVTVLDNKNILPPNDYLQAEYTDKVQVQEIRFGDLVGYQHLEAGTPSSGKSTFVNVFNGSTVYQIVYHAIAHTETHNNHLQDFWHMLSTFTLTESPEQHSSQMLVQVRSHGGLCPDGVCESIRAITNSGQVVINEKTTGTVAPRELLLLISEINKTNFQTILAKKFTGTCPTAYDGQEVVYTIQTNTTVQTLASCKVVIDDTHPLFALINQLLVKYSN